MLKYKTGGFVKPIEPVEIERETDKCVYIRGCRHAKLTDYYAFHDTWDEAKAYLMSKAEDSVFNARRNLERANSHLGNIKGLKP